jgi:hypothetical protein
MKNDPSRMRHQQKHEAEQVQHEQQASDAKTFSSTEELLRHDAARTEVPAAVEQRLKETLARERITPRSWWQRILPRL